MAMPSRGLYRMIQELDYKDEALRSLQLLDPVPWGRQGLSPLAAWVVTINKAVVESASIARWRLTKRGDNPMVIQVILVTVGGERIEIDGELEGDDRGMPDEVTRLRVLALL